MEYAKHRDGINIDILDAKVGVAIMVMYACVCVCVCMCGRRCVVAFSESQASHLFLSESSVTRQT